MFKKITILVELLLLLFTIFSYYGGLSQYATSDQFITKSRIVDRNFNDVPIIDGSNFSRIVVGLPGTVLKKILSLKYSQNDLIVADIHLTEFLPYTLVQVSLALLLMFYVVWVVGKMCNLNFRDNTDKILLIGIMLLNFPMLKGVIKVLKYDALSITLSLTAIVTYCLYRQNKNIKYFLFSIVLSAAALIEKSTTFSTLFLIIFFELFFLVINKNLFSRKTIALFLKTIRLGILVFFGFVILFIPKYWTNPLGAIEVFFEIPYYFKAFNNQIWAVLFLGLAVAFLIIRLLVKNIGMVRKKISKLEFKYLKWVISFLWIIFWVYLIFIKQGSNEIYNGGYGKNLGYYSTPDMAGASMSTLDNNQLTTRLKIGSSILMIYCFSVPEIFVFIIIVLPVVIIFSKKSLFKKVINKSLFLIFSFFFFLFLSYFILMPPVDPKYMLLLNLLLSISLIMVLINFLKHISYEIFTFITLLVGFNMVLTIFYTYPAYLSYISIFRNKNIQRTEFLDMNKYSWWMWVGWGEGSYSCFNYLSNNTSGIKNVAYDYLPPFYREDRLNPVSGFNLSKSDKDISTEVKRLKEEKADYLVVSKNMANRFLILNYLIKNYSGKAVYIDKVLGVEYAWLFKIDDLLTIK